MLLGIYFKSSRVFSTQAALISSSTFISKHVSDGVLTIGQKCHMLPLLQYLTLPLTSFGLKRNNWIFNWILFYFSSGIPVHLL